MARPRPVVFLQGIEGALVALSHEKPAYKTWVCGYVFCECFVFVQGDVHGRM